MKEYKFTINGNDYAIEISAIEDNTATVLVNGSPYDIDIKGMAAKPATKTPKIVRATEMPSTDIHPAVAKTARPVTGDTSVAAIKSPLPGVILDILVREGDTVKEGQHLIILEAMKMENNIDSDKRGVVKEIKVRKGDSVLEGDVLITIG